MRAATPCDTMARVCGFSTRETVEACTPARAAICLIPDSCLLMRAKLRGRGAARQAITPFPSLAHRNRSSIVLQTFARRWRTAIKGKENMMIETAAKRYRLGWDGTGRMGYAMAARLL